MMTALYAVCRRGDFPDRAIGVFSKGPSTGSGRTDKGLSSFREVSIGGAQYARRDCFEAISNFRTLLAMAPEHPRAAEAVLSIASCQIELKDNPSARRTLDELVKA